jgi:hypothetical protein
LALFQRAEEGVEGVETRNPHHLHRPAREETTLHYRSNYIQGRTKDLEGRKKIMYEFQRYEAEQQYYGYVNSAVLTGSWQPYVKNFAPNLTFDYGGRAAALWLEW